MEKLYINSCFFLLENGELPQPKEMRIERKRFYFDCGRNNRGSFLRVSEVSLFLYVGAPPPPPRKCPPGQKSNHCSKFPRAMIIKTGLPSIYKTEEILVSF